MWRPDCPNFTRPQLPPTLRQGPLPRVSAPNRFPKAPLETSFKLQRPPAVLDIGADAEDRGPLFDAKTPLWEHLVAHVFSAFGSRKPLKPTLLQPASQPQSPRAPTYAVLFHSLWPQCREDSLKSCAKATPAQTSKIMLNLYRLHSALPFLVF